MDPIVTYINWQYIDLLVLDWDEYGSQQWAEFDAAERDGVDGETLERVVQCPPKPEFVVHRIQGRK